MQHELVRELRSRLTQIRCRWESLLTLASMDVAAPLKNPAALAFMIEWTCEAVLAELSDPDALPAHPEVWKQRFCGAEKNPLLAYFSAGEQALREAVTASAFVVAQNEAPPLDVALVELNRAMAAVSSRQLYAFCSVCLHSGAEPWCHADPLPLDA